MQENVAGPVPAKTASPATAQADPWAVRDPSAPLGKCQWPGCKNPAATIERHSTMRGLRDVQVCNSPTCPDPEA